MLLGNRNYALIGTLLVIRTLMLLLWIHAGISFLFHFIADYTHMSYMYLKKTHVFTVPSMLSCHIHFCTYLEYLCNSTQRCPSV